ncbi:chorismate mutase [Novosphingopyxis sp. YJ-S2-01]|uniref:chorismate mutase n=1 Tax=Novosphingopyxis sp. YJ-S2-01 TaxID=2794021 RepID=UPI0018DBA02E|nr:chorismate mutase [Novosphingopyxis sp. YJ-S2-01]MBH9538785.1 chorismate mutase [Novosphingopyxis sp. YJ-S2-01]
MTQNPKSASRPIDNLREEIDALDDALLDLVEKRLALSKSIAAAKSAEDDRHLMIRPKRERQLIERLAGNTRAIPRASVSAIWRELMSLNLQSQRSTELALCADERRMHVADQARRRFGTVAPMVEVAEPAAALERARTRETIAIIELNPKADWWTVLAEDDDLVIFDALREEGGWVTAIVVGRLDSSHVPEDRRYCVVSASELLSRVVKGEPICPLASAGDWRLCLTDLASAHTLSDAA